MKTCTRCKIDKPFLNFSPDKRNKDGFQSWCKECRAEYRQLNKGKIDAKVKAAKKADPDRYRNLELLRNYSISLEQYNKTLADQGGVCAICGTDNPGEKAGKKLNFVVDHDHGCCSGRKSCGNCVRGLLCFACNFGIGSLRDSTTILQNAIRYLQEFQGD